MNTIILDTNAYSFLIEGDRKILKIVDKADFVYLSVIALGELLIGFETGNKAPENLATLKQFLSKPVVKVVSVTRNTSRLYAKIAVGLNKKGIPIPTNDIWIAAQTFETESTLITYDSHFLSIPTLKVWEYVK